MATAATLTAEQRAAQLIRLSPSQLPVLAGAWARRLARQLPGVEDEPICLTAYTHYAQAVEGLPCETESLRLTDAAREFFLSCLPRAAVEA